MFKNSSGDDRTTSDAQRGKKKAGKTGTEQGGTA